jgi:hypothetical protein
MQKICVPYHHTISLLKCAADSTTLVLVCALEAGCRKTFVTLPAMRSGQFSLLPLCRIVNHARGLIREYSPGHLCHFQLPQLTVPVPCGIPSPQHVEFSGAVFVPTSADSYFDPFHSLQRTNCHSFRESYLSEPKEVCGVVLCECNRCTVHRLWLSNSRGKCVLLPRGSHPLNGEHLERMCLRCM